MADLQRIARPVAWFVCGQGHAQIKIRIGKILGLTGLVRV